jgi:hypothetical protein
MRMIHGAIVLLATAGCASLPNRDPSGETFPTVRGTTLTSQAMTLPAALRGKPAILLVAYDQDAQFDVDRWVLGLLQLGTPIAQLFEVPTVSGFVPTVLGNTIDSGMRSGIPREDWASVITIYGDGGIVERFTGTERGLNARVLLLDDSGTVIWFHDRGFSPSVALQLDAAVRAIALTTDAASSDRPLKVREPTRP